MAGRRRHKSVRVRVGKNDERIDKKIAPLIRELWRAGIETIMSCESSWFDMIWVEFADADGIARFLNIVARYEPGWGNLYHRMNPRFTADRDEWWIYEVRPVDYALDVSENETHDGQPEFTFWYSVRFPPADLPEVMRRLRKHNEKQRRVKK